MVASIQCIIKIVCVENKYRKLFINPVVSFQTKKKSVEAKKRLQAEMIYLMMAGIFIASLVTSNLIFQKFFSWDFFGLYTFEISAGLIPYPVTFLVTDIISELYGKKRANRVVLAGLAASVFTLLIITAANHVEATSWSPLSNSEFSNVFGLTFVSVGASMAAYLAAQFVDVQFFHLWKKATNGKHLWLRNNASTFSSQLLDTAMVLALLMTFDALEWNLFGTLLLNGYLFKVIVALIDTPIIYIVVWRFRKHFNLQGHGAEIKLAY